MLVIHITKFSIRQPFVEMSKSEGSPGKRTVLLDYRSYFSFVSWIYEFENRHVMLGFTFLTSCIALILPSLMSNLFSVAVVSQASAADMSILTFFNDTAIDSRTNSQSVQYCLAARIYDTSFPH